MSFKFLRRNDLIMIVCDNPRFDITSQDMSYFVFTREVHQIDLYVGNYYCFIVLFKISRDLGD